MQEEAALVPFIASQPQLLSWLKVAELADQAPYMARKGSRNAWFGLYSADGMEPQ